MFPDHAKESLVQINASALGLGAVPAQGDAGEKRPVLYLSYKLLPCETRYNAIIEYKALQKLNVVARGSRQQISI